ncbi:MAG TPA: hypothetical protein DCX53_12715 [Anaerolineae bacterium]|nr:hypothetical protein [Anaerolineae bacterium]
MIFRKFPRQILITMLTAALILTACNVGAAPAPTIDANAINTAIVGTTIAQFSQQFTQTALAVQPTNTPTPTETPISLPTTDPNALPTFSLASPTPGGLPGFTQIAPPTSAVGTAALGDSCFNSVFEEDITIPDGSIVKGGESLKKAWKIRNTGTCTWDEGFRLVHIGGNIPNDNFASQYFEFQSKDSVAGGEAINLTVGFNAPCAAGKYEAHWRMQNDGGYYFGTILSVYIEVKGKTGGCS